MVDSVVALFETSLAEQKNSNLQYYNIVSKMKITQYLFLCNWTAA